MAQEEFLPKVRKEPNRKVNITANLHSLTKCVDCGEPSDDLFCDTPYKGNLGPLCQECFDMYFDEQY